MFEAVIVSKGPWFDGHVGYGRTPESAMIAARCYVPQDQGIWAHSLRRIESGFCSGCGLTRPAVALAPICGTFFAESSDRLLCDRCGPAMGVDEAEYLSLLQECVGCQERHTLNSLESGFCSECLGDSISAGMGENEVEW